MGGESCPVWPELANFRLFGNNLKVFGQFLEALFTFWQNFEPIFANLCSIGQIYTVINGQILYNNLIIWSHCFWIILAHLFVVKLYWCLGSGCGSVGSAVASNSRCPRFESSHWQNLYWTFVYLFTINCIEKTKINKKRPGMAHFFKLYWCLKRPTIN